MRMVNTKTANAIHNDDPHAVRMLPFRSTMPNRDTSADIPSKMRIATSSTFNAIAIAPLLVARHAVLLPAVDALVNASVRIMERDVNDAVLPLRRAHHSCKPFRAFIHRGH